MKPDQTRVESSRAKTTSSCKHVNQIPNAIPLGHPGIEIDLELVESAVDLLAERHAVELVEHGAMKAFADAICLRALGFSSTVIDILDSQVELVFMALATAEFGAAIGLVRGRA